MAATDTGPFDIGQVWRVGSDDDYNEYRIVATDEEVDPAYPIRLARIGMSPKRAKNTKWEAWDLEVEPKWFKRSNVRQVTPDP